MWIDVPVERLIARIRPDGRRPLAADRVEFERLYESRRNAYQLANLRLDASKGPTDGLVEQLIEWLECDT